MPRTDADFARIARLHADSLETSIISALGPNVLRAYYRFAARSSAEQIFVARDGGMIVGVALLSESPGSLVKRMVAANVGLVAVETLRSIVGDLTARRKILSFLAGRSERPAAVRGLPEIVQIFTDASRRGRGIGASLLSQAEAYLRDRHAERYFVKTVEGAADSALGFYDTQGFARAGIGREGDKRYVFLVKQLVAASTGAPADAR